MKLRVMVHERLTVCTAGSRTQIGTAYTRRSPGNQKHSIAKLSCTMLFQYMVIAETIISSMERLVSRAWMDSLTS